MADTANRSRGSGRRVRGAFVPEARCGYRNPTLSSILATQMPCRGHLHPKRKNGGSKTLPLFFGQASDCHRDLSGLFLPQPFFAGVQDLCRHHPSGVSGKAYYNLGRPSSPGSLVKGRHFLIRHTGLTVHRRIPIQPALSRWGSLWERTS